MCYVGRLKGSKWEAGSQNRCKTLANTRLDLRNAANSLQIEGKGGATWRPIRFGGGDLAGGRRDHIYVCIYIYMPVHNSALYYITYPRGRRY